MIHSVPHPPYQSLPLDTRVRVNPDLPQSILDELQKQGINPEKQYVIVDHAMRFYLPENYQYQQVMLDSKTVTACICSEFRTVRLHTGIFVNLDYLITDDDNWFLAPLGVHSAPSPAFEVDDHVIVEDCGYRVAGYHVPTIKTETMMGDVLVNSVTYPRNLYDRSIVINSEFPYVYDLISDEYSTPRKRTATKAEMTLSKRGACWKRQSPIPVQEACDDSLDGKIRAAFAFSEIEYIMTGETVSRSATILIPVACSDITRPWYPSYYQFKCNDEQINNKIKDKYRTDHDKTIALGFICNNLGIGNLVRDYITKPA